MFVVDMHCDSLGLVSGDRGLVTKYNVSREWQYMQLFAAFVPNGETTPYMRRRTLLRLVDSYISEINRLKLVPIYECRSRLLEDYGEILCDALDRGRRRSFCRLRGALDGL